MNKVTAILPMRAGSQRVKDKNIRKIKGIPLWKYITVTAHNTELIDKLVINTDIQEVFDTALYNLFLFDLIEREEHLRSNCNMNMVIEDTLNKIDGKYFIQLHATSPLLKSETLDKAIKTFFENMNVFESLFSVTD